MQTTANGMKKRRMIDYKWELVILLFFAFFLNQADRQIFNVLLSDIRDDLGLTNDNMGTIAMVMNIVYGVLVPVGGLLAVHIKKKYILVGALFLWSTSTVFTGCANSFIAVLLLRSVATGGGEAFYSPSAVSLIAESHDKTTSSTALSIHQSALYIGFILSSVLAPLMAAAWGWRKAFYLFGGIGIVLAVILALRIREAKPATTRKDDEASIGQSLKAFFACPTAWLLTLACAGFQFVGIAFYTWAPTYLIEELGVSKAAAGFHAAFYVQMASIIGVMIGARISDRHVSHNYRMRAWVQTIGLVLGAPFVFLMGSSGNLWIVNVAMLGYGFFKGMYDSNFYTTLYDVIAPRYRSAAASFILMFSFLVGAFSPKLLGSLSTAGYTLAYGLQWMAVVLALSAIPIILASFFTLKKDIAKIYQ